MEPGDIRAASKEIEIALYFVSDDFSGASCWVQLPKDCKAKVEAIGRDEQGGFLNMDDGNVFRLPPPTLDDDTLRLFGDDLETVQDRMREVHLSDLDEMLSKDEIVIMELDEFQSPMGEYPVSKVPYESRIGFGV